MYKQITVWKHYGGGRVGRLNCFQDLRSNQFCVQSLDYFTLPLDAQRIREMDYQLVELFIEIEPAARCEWFETVEDAIAAHERDFPNT
jgi:hypothetical protein